jgi:hypothetical protein
MTAIRKMPSDDGSQLQLLYHRDSLEYGQASSNVYDGACVKTRRVRVSVLRKQTTTQSECAKRRLTTKVNSWRFHREHSKLQGDKQARMKTEQCLEVRRQWE